MIMKKLGQGLAKIGNVTDNIGGMAGSSAAHVVNAVDDIADGAKNVARNMSDDFAEGFEGARKASKHSYQQTRNKSGRVQREIEDGIRNPDGTRKPKVKEAKTPNEPIEDAASQAVQYRKKAQDATAFTYDGKQYVRTGTDGNYQYYSRKGKKGEWSSVTGEEFGTAHSGNVSAQEAFGRQVDIENAFRTATTETGEHAGIDLLQFASDHPVGTALAGIGVGIVGMNIFDDD